MQKIYNIDNLNLLIKNLLDKKVVLIGGCFDVIHSGHLQFIKASKKLGDTLILLLENDKTIKKNKGENRPLNKQLIRAENLAKLGEIDYIILLDNNMENISYDSLVSSLKPAIIATTKGDENIAHKIRQAKLVGAKVEEVVERLPYSTTEILSSNKRYEIK